MNRILQLLTLNIKSIFIIVSACLCAQYSLAEGSKQLEPNPNGKTKLLVGIDKTKYATYDSDKWNRLYIHIASTSEKIYLGFGNAFKDTQGKDSVKTLYYRIKDPKGKVVGTSALVPRRGKGYIDSLIRSGGPRGLSGLGVGYEPIIIENLPEVGDYYIEFSTTNTNTFHPKTDDIQDQRAIFEFFDVTVADGNTPKPGRLWSYSWQLIAPGHDVRSYSEFFIYTKDSVVTSLKLNGIEPLVFTVMCNQLGTTTSNLFTESRRSTPGANTAYPEFKIFLQDPDNNVYPAYNAEIKLDNPKLNGCTQEGLCIGVTYNLQKPINAELLLDFDGIPGLTGNDRVLNYTLKQGSSCIPWDGKDASGTIVTTAFDIYTTVLTGLTNFPLFDVERNPNGLIVDLVRPTAKPLAVFWDDTKLKPATGLPDAQLSSPPGGCNSSSGCHIFDGTINSAYNGDNNTMNTWWNVYEPIKTTVYYNSVPKVDAGPPLKVCSRTVSTQIGTVNTTGSSDDIYEWKVIRGNEPFPGDPSLAQPTVNLAAFARDTVWFEVTLKRNGCSDKDSTFLFTTSDKGPTVSGFRSACVNSKEVRYTVTDPLATNIKWEITNGTQTGTGATVVNNVKTIDVDWPGITGTGYSIKVTADYPTCGTFSRIIPVELVNSAAALKAPEIVGDTIVCSNDGLIHLYEAPFAKGYEYRWFVESKGSLAPGENYQGMEKTTNSFVFKNNTGPSHVELNLLGLCAGNLPSQAFRFKLKINPGPSISDADFKICSGDSLRVISPGAGATQPDWRYQWSPTYGLSAYNIKSPKANIITTGGDSIVYQVKATNKFNCAVTKEVKVKIFPKPTKLELIGPNVLCQELDPSAPAPVVKFTLKSKHAAAPEWKIRTSFDKAVPNSPDPINPNINSVDVSTEINRTKDEQWLFYNLYSNELGYRKGVDNDWARCQYRDSVKISFKKLIVYKPYLDDVICIHPGISKHTAFSNGGKQYEWYASNATTVTPIYNNTTKTQDSVEIEWNKTPLTNPYKVWVYQINGENDDCKVEPPKQDDILEVNLIDTTMVSVLDTVNICLGQPLKLEATSTAPFPPSSLQYLTWRPVSAPPGAPLIKGTDKYEYVPTDTTRTGTPALYEVIFDNGCKNVKQINVNIYPTPVNPILQDKLIFCSDNQEADTIVTRPDFPTQGTGFYDYKWEPLLEYEPIIPGVDTSSIIVKKEQEYKLTIYNSFGCFSRDSVIVNDLCPPRIFVPRAITPNEAKDPNNNDVLKIFGAHFVNFKMRIFNRWGEIVYESTDRNEAWDGTYNGEPVPVGVYPLVITYDSEFENDNENPRIYNGSVTVIR